MTSCKGRIQIKAVGEQVAEVNIGTWEGKRAALGSTRSTKLDNIMPLKNIIYKYNSDYEANTSRVGTKTTLRSQNMLQV